MLDKAKWADEDITTLKGYLDNLYTPIQISDLMNVPIERVRKKIYLLKQKGTHIRKIRQEWSNEDVITLIGYLKKDYTPEKISDLMYIPLDRIRKKIYWLSKHNNTRKVNQILLSYNIKKENKSYNDKVAKKVVSNFVWTEQQSADIFMYKEKGYSNKQISDIMNISVSRIYMRIYHLKNAEKLCEKAKTNRLKRLEGKTPKERNMDTLPWAEKDFKKLIRLYNEGKTFNEISISLNRNPTATKVKISLYKESLMCSRFGKDWLQEEINELKKDKINIPNFCLRWKRGNQEVQAKRHHIKRDGLEIFKTTITASRSCRILRTIVNTKTPKEYDNVPNKNYVQEALYGSLRNINSPILTLLGNTPERFINMLNKYNILGDNFIYSNEHEPDTAVKVYELVKKMGININISLGDILGANPQRLIDLDLMGRWDTESNLVKTSFNKQKLSISGDKYFMFTLSVFMKRNETMSHYIKSILEELLNINVEAIMVSDMNVDKFNVYAPHYDIQAYRYCDTSPMISILIQYS